MRDSNGSVESPFIHRTTTMPPENSHLTCSASEHGTRVNGANLVLRWFLEGSVGEPSIRRTSRWRDISRVFIAYLLGSIQHSISVEVFYQLDFLVLLLKRFFVPILPDISNGEMM